MTQSLRAVTTTDSLRDEMCLSFVSFAYGALVWYWNDAKGKPTFCVLLLEQQR